MSNFWILPNGELRCRSCLTAFKPEGQEREYGYICPECGAEGEASDSEEPDTDEG